MSDKLNLNPSFPRLSISPDKVEKIKHYCFKTSDGGLVILNFRKCDDGRIEVVVLGDSVEPREATYLDDFDADGLSDFNWGVVAIVDEFNLGNAKCVNRVYDILNRKEWED